MRQNGLRSCAEWSEDTVTSVASETASPSVTARLHILEVLVFRSTQCAIAITTILAFAGPVLAQEERARGPENVVQMEDAPPGLPFSPAVRAAGMIYLSGQIGNVPGTLELRNGVEAQTRQTMENIKAVLKAAGASLYDIVKCTVFIADMSHYGAVNAVYAEFWDGPPPARSAVGANGLALGALLEIECLARDPAARTTR